MTKKIEDLNEEQIHQMVTIAAEYEQQALAGDDSYNVEEIRKGIDFIYELSELKSPEIVICASPTDMCEEAEVKQGETIDYLGCGYDAGWTAFYDYFERIGIPFEKEWNFGAWRDFVLKSGVFATVLCENIAFVCIRPYVVKRNDRGDLHCENGPAIAWRNGYQEFALNGVWMDQWMVETQPEKINPKKVLETQNAEQRRELIRKIGVERFIQAAGASVLNKQGNYELLSVRLSDDVLDARYLKMLNPSMGTWHVEGVDPQCSTVQEALNWRAGNIKEEWKPEVLT